MSLRGGKRTDEFNTSSLTNWKVLLSEQKAIITSPTISPALISENTTPRRRFSHPSMISLTVPSRSFPTKVRTAITAMKMRANATIFITCSEPWIYCPSHPLTIVAKRNDSHTPAMMDMMAITWEIKPFLKPCTTAGTKQIKRMISNMFIFLVKIVYLQFEKIRP